MIVLPAPFVEMRGVSPRSARCQVTSLCVPVTSIAATASIATVLFAPEMSILRHSPATVSVLRWPTICSVSPVHAIDRF